MMEGRRDKVDGRRRRRKRRKNIRRCISMNWFAANKLGRVVLSGVKSISYVTHSRVEEEEC